MHGAGKQPGWAGTDRGSTEVVRVGGKFCKKRFVRARFLLM